MLIFFVFLASVYCDSIIVGDIRISALSSTLLRVEYKGPNGFEDRTTFMVVDRSAFKGIPITKINETKEGILLGTDYYKVLVKAVDPLPSDVCSEFMSKTDVSKPVRSPFYPDGAKADNQRECCDICKNDNTCVGYVFAGKDSTESNCWPLMSFESTVTTEDREVGCVLPGCGKPIETLVVTSPNDKVLYQMPETGASNLLYWPSPLSESAYAIQDFPRFFVPSWGPTPKSENVQQYGDTNGYDFTNNVAGDTYVFLLGDTLDSWYDSRHEFLKLTGPTELIPDFAWGTWFTWWHSYSESEAKDDIDHWKSRKLPLDVWGLDMNWRYTDNKKDRFYDNPNSDLFANFTEWFEYLHKNNLRTYFNDHPFPSADQTTEKEINFRWNGLTEWMEKGLDFWWYDKNWGFSVPPPNVPPVGGWDVSHTDGNWFGLDNAAWGTHVFHMIVKIYDLDHRPPSFPRPITLTKFAQPDWTPLKPSIEAAESPSQHRYPVWWTGDGVNLQASIETMVDGGVHHFKPYVHSDCGGDYRGSAGDMLRWTSHCAFGTIFRYHGNDHRPWTYNDEVEDVVRTYLNMRYKMMPSLIAAGAKATEDGTPFVSRCDLFWPQYDEAAASNQYIFLDDILVAPIYNSEHNVTKRSVWIPEGTWIDSWTGKEIAGPKTIDISLPYDQQPMWHKKGGFLVTVDDHSSTNVEMQDWSVITLEIWPERKNSEVSRYIVERSTQENSIVDTHLTLTSTELGTFVLRIKPTTRRAWITRFHLPVGLKASVAILSGDGYDKELGITHFQPVKTTEKFFPFGGAGTRPAAGTGLIAEIEIPPLENEAVLKVSLDV